MTTLSAQQVSQDWKNSADRAARDYSETLHNLRVDPVKAADAMRSGDKQREQMKYNTWPNV